MEFGFWHLTCAILVPGVLLASWIDYSQRRVPNWLNLAQFSNHRKITKNLLHAG